MEEKIMAMRFSRPRLGVGMKLWLSFTVVFWVPVLLLCFLFLSRTGTALYNDLTRFAQTNLLAAQNVLDERPRALAGVLAHAVSRPALRQAFARGDRAQIREELLLLGAEQPHVEILLAVDHKLKVLARRNTAAGESLHPVRGLVSAILTGQPSISLELVDAGFLARENQTLVKRVYGSGIAQLVVVPVRDGDRVVGAVVAGILLSGDPWTGNTVFDRFAVETALFAGERIESSLLHATSSLPRSSWTSGQPMPEPIRNELALGRSFSGRIQGVDGVVAVAFLPLRDSSSRIIGALGVSMPARDIRRWVWKEIGLSLLIVASLGLAISLAIILLATRDITRPIVFIKNAMETFGKGEIGTRAELVTGDEFEDLARGFNAMSDEIRRREEKLKKHYQVAKLLMSTLDLDDLLKKMLAIVVEVTESSMGIIYLHEKDTGLLVPKSQFGVSSEIMPIGAGEGYPGQAAAERRPLLLRPNLDDQGAATIGLGFVRQPPRQLAYIPLICQESLHGILVLGKTDDYQDEEKMLFDYLANQLAIALDNALLHQHIHALSITDALTGLYNRRFMNEIMEKKWSASVRHGMPLAILLGDIDNFKSINDTYGHGRGDEVLRLLGTIMRRNVRSEDIASRYGGEEFVVVMEKTGEEEALALAGRIAAQLKDHDFPWMERRVTISLGLAVFPDAAVASAAELVQAADHAMYEAKMNGKDRLVIFRPTSPAAS